MDFNTKKHTLKFKFDAGTSRGVLRTKDSWFVQLSHDGKSGIGECGILKGLSIENHDTFDNDIKNILNGLNVDSDVFNPENIYSYPSLRFAIEMAMIDLKSQQNGILIENSFTKGKGTIPINGLVWMGDYRFMFEQIKQKIDSGFSCIKIKIGAIDFKEELQLLQYIRKDFTKSDIELRVDANGAFKPDEAIEKLKRLAEYELHSIEQPIRQGQHKEMAELCANTPLHIALDEELIGVLDPVDKNNLLETIQPQYIILKPSLLGGYRASEEWIRSAEDHNIKYWITSALESNIGLNAIAQWTYELGVDIPQGLGTGQLYHNNFEGPLHIENGALCFNPEIPVYQNFKLF